jgi:uncharacterized pyridoxal phosphate-containing UPF0001 family protein
LPPDIEGYAVSAGSSLETPTLHDQHGQWPQAESVEDFRRNLAAVHARIAAACRRAERVRRCFVLLRDLRDRLRQEAPDGIGLEDLSMGMSGDYEIAIEEGATVVRVGQAIYGARSTPDTYYWPSAADKEPHHHDRDFHERG